MKTKVLRLLRDESGYVTALALIAMPLLLGFSLLVIDVARGNNLHTDLQNAVDALALAGARELDGGPDSIDRAEAAMTDLLNNQARFSDGGSVIVNADEVTWHFLASIPESDDDPIDPLEDYETNDPFDAAYVWVISNQRSMTSLFPLPVTLSEDTAQFQAEAVATYEVSACDVTPLFICNPFEDDPSGKSFQELFAEGAFYSRQLILNFNGGATPGPGNFGWLQVADPGGDALRDALASSHPGECYSMRGLTTKTGGTIGPAEQGLNVRMDIYAGSMSDTSADNRPAPNVRKGEKDPTKNSACQSYTEETDTTLAMGFPTTSIPGGSYGTQTLPNGTLSGDNWDLPTYWLRNHIATLPTGMRVTDPAGNTTGTPSRYDVYQYEIANNLLTSLANTAPNGEIGAPRCFKGPAPTAADAERRTLFAAVIDCNATTFAGQTTFAHPTAFVSMFLTKPMVTSGSMKQLYAEVTDVTGNSGNGTLETFLREESQLVR